LPSAAGGYTGPGGSTAQALDGGLSPLGRLIDMPGPIYRVDLRLPSNLAFVPTAERLTCTLALQVGFTFADAHDLRRGVKEVCECLIRSASRTVQPGVALGLLVGSSYLSVELKRDEAEPELPSLWLLAADCHGETLLMLLSQLVDALDINWDRRRGMSITVSKFGTPGLRTP